MGKPLRYYSDTWKQGYYFCLIKMADGMGGYE